MSESDQITELVKAIQESETQTRRELQSVNSALKEMANNFSQYWQHLAVYEEDKKHDNEFKKEVREHIKEARPLLSYVKDQKATSSKVKTAFYVAVMFAVLGLLGFNLR